MLQRFSVIACILCFCGCAKEEKKEEPKEKPKKPETRLVGRIQSRPSGKDFVLLESYGKWTVEEGTILYSYGDQGRSAALETSGEKLGQFVAADVKSGHVEIGDAVYFRALPPESALTKSDPQPPPTAPAQAPAASMPKPVAPADASSAPVIEPVPLPSY